MGDAKVGLIQNRWSDPEIFNPVFNFLKYYNVESGMVIVVCLNFFGKKTMSAGLCNLDLKNSYLSSMTFSKHLETS